MPALEPTSLTAQTLSVDLDQARAALTELDRAALAAIGIDAVTLDQPVTLASRRPLTSRARHVLQRATEHAQAGTGKVEERHLLAALLALDAPDAAATLLTQLGIDITAARRRLDDLSSPQAAFTIRDRATVRQARPCGSARYRLTVVGEPASTIPPDRRAAPVHRRRVEVRPNAFTTLRPRAGFCARASPRMSLKSRMSSGRT